MARPILLNTVPHVDDPALMERIVTGRPLTPYMVDPTPSRAPGNRRQRRARTRKGRR